MKIFVATDISIVVSNGRVFAYQKYSTILRRYYNAFGTIVICSRIATPDVTTNSYEDITDIIDSIVEVPSLYQIFLNKLNMRIESAMKTCSLVVCRCPAISAFKASDIARKLKIPYLSESMGDPWDAYWNHGIQGKVIAPYMFFKMRNVVENADYAVYVTRKFLQDRYPCKKESIAASNVLIKEIGEDVFSRRVQKVKSFNKNELTLMTTAAIDVWYKGQQYVIKAIKKLNDKGINIKYLIVGEGDKTFLQTIADTEGVSSQVKFTGRLPLEEVFSLLDTADIYIQPSLQEGLPRSVIEAMSRGCACIGAKTAGIPELLDDEMVVRRKSINDIVDKIIRYHDMTEHERLEISKRNFLEAKQYTSLVLDERRNKYFERIRKELME